MLPALEGADDRMRRVAGVGACVTVRRVVAAADVAAAQADPQMQPPTPDSETVFAAVDLGWQLEDGDLIEMGAGRRHVVRHCAEGS